MAYSCKTIGGEVRARRPKVRRSREWASAGEVLVNTAREEATRIIDDAHSSTNVFSADTPILLCALSRVAAQNVLGVCPVRHRRHLL